MSVAFTNQQWWLNHTQIPRSLRFNSPDSAYLNKTFSSNGGNKYTFSAWVKRTALGTQNLFSCTVGSGSGGNYEMIRFTSDDTLMLITNSDGDSATYAYQLATNAVFRDTSAWYHVVVTADYSTRVGRIYVNGIQQSTTRSYGDGVNDISSVQRINTTADQHIFGRFLTSYSSFYLADVHFIDGQALEPTAFGTFDENGDWQKIPYEGTYGTNGFHLPFTDNSSAAALGTDTSGNGNTWSVNNISVTDGAGNDSFVDSPTSYGDDRGNGAEVRGNYCTWNPLRSLASLLNGNLDHSNITTNFEGSTGTIYVSTGKWYWEWLITSAVSDTMIGVATNDHPLNSNYSASTTSWTYFSANGQKYGNGANGAAYGASWSNGDLIGIALDMDAGSITFYKNGTSQGVAFSTGIQGKSVTPLISGFNTTGAKGSANFGQRPFAYQAPAGYKALCTTNLPDPTISNPSEVMDVKLYTGNGGTQTISGLGFSPDFVWIKQRDTTRNHVLYDTVRGATKALLSSTTDSEQTYSTSLTAFNSDGFALGADDKSNGASGSYVAWTWDAGSSTVTNTQGSITSSVRANPSAGFSIVKYTNVASTNSTIGHGLGVAPKLLIVRYINQASGWFVYHADTGAGNYLQLQSTGASTSLSSLWNNTAPTSTVFSVGTAWTSSADTIAYCFAPVDGYSSFGSYTGNGSADGPFVFTGMRPRWLMVKRSDSTGGWYMFDTSREPYNLVNDFLFAHSSAAEQTFTFGDITSNGFKLRDNSADWNASGGTYIYAAFAESPFKTSRAR